MASVTWLSAVSADWGTASDWSTGSVPGAADDVTLDAAGTYVVSIAVGESFTVNSLNMSGGGAVSIAGTLDFDNASDASFNVGPVTIEPGGLLSGEGVLFGPGPMLNQGTIAGNADIDTGGQALFITPSGTFTNAGLMLATASGNLDIDAGANGSFANVAGGVLTGGTYQADTVSTLVFVTPGTAPAFTTIEATLTFNGSASAIDNNQSGTGTFTGIEAALTNIGTAGSLNILGGRDYSSSVALTDSGVLNLGGGTLGATGLTVTSDGTIVGFGTIVPAIANAGTVEAAGGLLAPAGGISDGGALLVDTGATMALNGTFTHAVTDNGTVQATGGALKLSGAISGNGGFAIEGGSGSTPTTLELDTASNGQVSFDGAFAALALGAPASFGGSIAGFGVGDSIVLAGVTGDAATLSGTTLDVTDGGTTVDTLSLTGEAAGTKFSAVPNGGGGTVVTLAQQGLQFNFSYDPSVAGAPAGFKTALIAAAQDLSALILDPITINLKVGYGEDNGQLLSGSESTGGPFGTFFTYAQLKSELAANASSPADVGAVANLPSSDPTGGGNFLVSYAEQKAWGLVASTASELDGTVGFSGDAPYDYDPSDRAVAGELDFIGVAEHELTHALGRIAGPGLAANEYAPLELFRYASPGTLELTGGLPAYFSVDGGATNLDDYDTTSDYADWSSSAGNDSFNAVSLTGVENPVTPVDVTEMSVLGYEVACYAAGTRILTAHGEKPVETLRPGDAVPGLASGRLRRVRWIGQRSVDVTRHPRPREVAPIRVRAGAFAEGMPHRDLLLSPDHAVFAGGALVPVRYLVNGATVRREPAGYVTYCHVELADDAGAAVHEVILAEGLPAESYLDTGNRGAFENGAAPARLHPDFARVDWVAASPV